MASELKVLLTGDGSKLRQELVKTASEVNKVERQTKRAEKELKSMQSTAHNAASSFMNLRNAIKTGDIRGVSDNFVQLGGNIKQLLPNLSKLGPALVNPWVLAGTAIAGGTTALIKYNVELEKTVMRTEQFTGLSGNALYSLRNGIKSVADTFGKDFNDVLSSVDGLMNQFHIDGESALNIIRDGFVGGCDDGGKMFDMISKYSGAFHDAGISASEMVAIIGNTRSGIFSEEGMELFSKGAMKIREFSSSLQQSLTAVGINADDMYNKLQSGQMTTVQAIQQISNKLKELNPQSQEVGNVLKDVFGKKAAAAGYELVTALADVETDLDKVKEQTGEWGQAMEDLQKADREMENALSSLFGIADGGFSTMTTRLKADVYSAVAKVINGFIDLYNKNILVRGAVTGLATSFKNTWEVVKAILKLFMNSLNSLGDMIQGVLELDWSKVKSSWQNGMKNILTIIADTFANLKENTSNAVNQTLNGQIEKIEIEPVKSGGNGSNFKGGGKTSNRGGGSVKGSGGRSSNATPSSNVTDQSKKIEYEANSIADLENKVKSLNDKLNNTNVSDDRLKQILAEKKGYEEQIETLKIRNGFKEPPKVEVEPVIDPNSLTGINKQLSEKQAQIELEVVGTEQYNKLAKDIAELTGKKNEIELQIKTDTMDEATKKTNDLIAAQQKLQQTYAAVSSTLNSVSSAFSSVGSMMKDGAMKTAMSVGAILAQSIAQMVSAYASACAQASSLGPWAWLAFAATGLATLTATIVGVKNATSGIESYATGGIIGGNTTIGDYNIARVNKGEMILNNRQQGRLFSMLDGNGYYSSNHHNSDVEFKIKGKELVGVLHNYNTKTNRVF